MRRLLRSSSQFGSEEFGEFNDISIEAFSEYETLNNRNKTNYTVFTSVVWQF